LLPSFPGKHEPSWRHSRESVNVAAIIARKA
jgi:hypothetical protein